MQAQKSDAIAVKKTLVASKDDRADKWTVYGSVTYMSNGEGIGGLSVRLYDKDLLFDDWLGTTQTDSSGCFKIVYEQRAFGDLFESKPDLYLKVTDNKGRILYNSKDAVRFDAGREEVFEIQI